MFIQCSLKYTGWFDSAIQQRIILYIKSRICLRCVVCLFSRAVPRPGGRLRKTDCMSTSKSSHSKAEHGRSAPHFTKWCASLVFSYTGLLNSWLQTPALTTCTEVMAKGIILPQSVRMVGAQPSKAIDVTSGLRRADLMCVFCRGMLYLLYMYDIERPQQSLLMYMLVASTSMFAMMTLAMKTGFRKSICSNRALSPQCSQTWYPVATDAFQETSVIYQW